MSNENILHVLTGGNKMVKSGFGSYNSIEK